MAMTETQKTDAYQFFVVAFGAVTGVEYMNQLDAAYSAGMSTKDIVNVYTTKPQFTSQYPAYLTNQQFAQKLVANVVGNSATAEAKAAAESEIQAALNAGWSRGDVIYQIFSNLADKPHDDAVWGNTAKMFANKVAVSQYLTEVKLVSETDQAKLQGYLSNVTADSDVSTPKAIEGVINGGGASTVALTLGNDNIVATQEGMTFTAGLAQGGFLGNVSNTLESGDSIIAKGEGNKLHVDLTVSVSGGIPVAPAISATTKNVQVVEFRNQFTQLDLLATPHGNMSTIDAEKMLGVKEWWTVNSRSDIQIEDVRSTPADTTIGMRDTDPEVGMYVYFDPDHIKGGEAVTTALTLRLVNKEHPDTLGDTSIEGVSFKLGGEAYVLTSAAIAAAQTYPAWREALEAAAKTIPALAGVSFVLNPDNTITLIDADGRTFEKGGWKFVGDQVPADGVLEWSQTIGVPVVDELLVSTNIKLDNVGRTSQGGELDVGSLGDGGVQVFNVEVDRSSWLTSMTSTEHLNNNAPGNGVTREYLEEVYAVNKDGAKGNLTVGSAEYTNNVRHPDNRVDTNGLVDVRKFDASAFKGQVNLGATLTDESIVRYLDGATDPVTFEYTMSAQNDILNISVQDDLDADPDFVLDINMGAGNDRLIFESGNDLASTSVDGGEGNNTIVVRSDVGMSATNTFQEFKNFQTYEIEGGNSAHNFTSLNGVKTVVVATGGAATTVLRDLPADIAAVSVSGKNQTIGTANNANQSFATIDVQAAKAAELTVNLDNTARTTGKLTVDTLNVRDNQADLNDKSAVTTLNIASNGVRNTSNAIDAILADGVSTFNLSGSQALAVQIDAAAKTAGNVNGYQNLVVNGAAAKGNLSVGIDTAIVNKLATQDKTMTFTGGEGTKDNLTFNGGAIAVMKALSTVSGFETVTFEDGGKYNAVNTTGVNLYRSYEGDALQIINLRGEENVQIGHKLGTAMTANTNTVMNTGGDQAFVTNAVSASSKINVDIVGAAAAQKINTDGYTTLALKLTADKTLQNGFKAYTLDLSEQSYDGIGDAWVAGTVAADVDLTVAGTTVPVNHISRVELKNVVVTGGTGEVDAGGAAVSSADLGQQLSTVKLVDVSGYAGHVTAAIDAREVATVKSASGVDTEYDTGNTVVKVGQFGVDFTVEQAMYKNGALDATNGKVVTFEFTKDALVNASAAGSTDFDWKIDGFQGVNAGATVVGGAAGGAGNLTVLDVSALGARTLADLKMTDVGGDLHITDNSGAHNYEIVLVGVTQAVLGLENFKFAA